MIVEILTILNRIYYGGFVGNAPKTWGLTEEECLQKAPPFVINNVVDVPEFLAVLVFLYGVNPNLPPSQLPGGRQFVHNMVLAIMRYAIDNELVIPESQEYTNFVEITKQLFLANPSSRNIALVKDMIVTLHDQALVTDLADRLPERPILGFVPDIEPDAMLALTNLFEIVAEALDPSNPKRDELLTFARQIVRDQWPFSSLVFACQILLMNHLPADQLLDFLGELHQQELAPIVWMRLYADLGRRGDFAIPPVFMQTDNLRQKAMLAWALSQKREIAVTDLILNALDYLGGYEEENMRWIEVMITALANNGDPTWPDKLVLKASQMGDLNEGIALLIFKRVRQEKAALRASQFREEEALIT